MGGWKVARASETIEDRAAFWRVEDRAAFWRVEDRAAFWRVEDRAAFWRVEDLARGWCGWDYESSSNPSVPIKNASGHPR
jgi:hypothetical protein